MIILQYLKKLCTMIIIILCIEVVWYFTGITFDANIRVVLITLMILVVLRTALDIVILFNIEDNKNDKK